MVPYYFGDRNRDPTFRDLFIFIKTTEDIPNTAHGASAVILYYLQDL